MVFSLFRGGETRVASIGFWEICPIGYLHDMVPPHLPSRYGLPVIKLLALVLPMATLLSACVQLSSAGAQVRVLKEEQAAMLSACQPLGQVSVSSEDALRNATAAMSGDTALMSVRDVGGSIYIRGMVYRCQNIVAAPMAIIPPSTIQGTPVSESEAARKSATCHEKGGVWTGHQCVIEID